MEQGKVSVIMGIYNCFETLEQAVNSIQNQTYDNWELIMCDDGSTDNTLEIARKLAREDDRLILLRNKKNYGLNKTLNHCLTKASGEYIARMDGDDVCDPTRFEKQVTFLKTHSEYDIVSSAMYFFDENGRWGENHVQESPQAIDVVSESCICHAPVMMRKECMDAVEGYTEDVHMLRVEDVNLWIKLYAKGYRCYNLQEPLYGMRNDKNATNRRKYRYRINETYVRLLGCMQLHTGLKSYVKAFKPMVVGLIPANVRSAIRRKQWRS